MKTGQPSLNFLFLCQDESETSELVFISCKLEDDFEKLSHKKSLVNSYLV